MPTYEFRCPEGHDFEKFYRSIGAAPAEVQCPRCGIVATRLMSAGGGLVFKGSGFYITDYGKDGKKAQPTSAPKDASSKVESTKGENSKGENSKGESSKAESTKAEKGSSEKPVSVPAAKPAAEPAAKAKPTKE